MGIVTFVSLIIAALITTSGQLLLKKGSQVLVTTLNGQKDYKLSLQLVNKLFTIIFEPHIFIAIIFYVAGMLFWIKIISQAELNYAYPVLIGITILLTSIASTLIFKESFTMFKLAGMACIIAGIFLTTR